MKCPLLAFAWGNEGGKEPLIYPDCIKGECAWWLEDINMCAIRDLALELRYTQFRLLDIKDRIPHEEQFRKDK